MMRVPLLLEVAQLLGTAAPMALESWASSGPAQTARTAVPREVLTPARVVTPLAPAAGVGGLRSCRLAGLAWL
ncbi:MAG: hypothetical protein ABSF28_11835 [Terracidiphilus sp.]